MARTCTEEGGKKERMLEGEGGEQERKCGGESADGGRSWEETERTAQKAVERSLLREHNYRLYMICGTVAVHSSQVYTIYTIFLLI